VNPWAVLGLPPGADRDAIRRAYARKLKGTNPEDDPEGFMALRAAHDAALEQLKWRQIWPDGDEVAPADAPASAQAQADAPAWQPPAAAPEPPAVDPAQAAKAAERAADQADLIARQQALIDLIDAGGDQAEQQRALDLLLAAPALIDIMARDRIEAWVAAVLADRLPASDPVIVHAIERFGWAELPLGQRPADVARLLRRREEGEFVAEIARRHTPLHVGYMALRDPPGPSWWRHLKAVFSAEPAQTRQILGLLDGPLPGMADWLNADATAWWRTYHAVPRLRLWMILTMIPLVSLLLVGVVAASGWPQSAQAGFSLLVWASPWGLLWLLRRRLQWQSDWDRPEWHFAAWPLAVLALPVLAAIWPAVPVLIPLFLLPLLLVVGWTILANDRLQPDDWRDLVPGIVRSQPAWLLLALLVGGAPASDGLGAVRGLAIAGCALAWWQAGDQMCWSARRLLSRWGERLGGALAPWLLLAAGGAAALLILGLALIDAGLVGRALGLLALPMLAGLVAFRMVSGWQQLGPLAALAGLVLLCLELLSWIDPGTVGAGGIIAGLGDGSWLIDDRTGLPRSGLIFVAVFAVTSLWRGWRGQAANNGSWTSRLIIIGIAIATVVGISLFYPRSPERPPSRAVAQSGLSQPAKPDGDTRRWLDDAALMPQLPPGEYPYEVRLVVDQKGRVIFCSMARSSGVARLDKSLCDQLKARARFKPGLNDAGAPMATVENFSGRVRRVAPAARPPAPPISCPAGTGSGPMVAEPCMPDRWFYDGSYPPAALAAGHSGTVEYRLEVGTDGRVAECAIERGSGHTALDAGTCQLLRARARFVPARDVDGSAMVWTYRGSIRWVLGDR
jgi:TonB family protein